MSNEEPKLICPRMSTFDTETDCLESQCAFWISQDLELRIFGCADKVSAITGATWLKHMVTG